MVQVVGRFNCFGRFAALKRGHPIPDELEQAKSFARGIAESVHAKELVAATT
ncbi:MAG: hypothetical protein NTY79_04735 [Chloroflexi bacterium]|nr:hypothetical protein [Chloroflexota bacterium]